MEHVVPVLEVNGVLNEEIDDRGVGIFSPQNFSPSGTRTGSREGEEGD